MKKRPKKVFASIRVKYITVLALSSLLLTFILNFAASALAEKGSYREALARERRDFTLLVNAARGGITDQRFFSAFLNKRDKESQLVVDFIGQPEKTIDWRDGDSEEAPAQIYRLDQHTFTFSRDYGLKNAPFFHKTPGSRRDRPKTGPRKIENELVGFIYNDKNLRLSYIVNPDDLSDEHIDALYADQLIIMVAALAGYLILSLFLFGKYLTPISSITKNIKQIQAKGFDGSIKIIKTGDEFETLSRSFNKMVASLRERWREQKRFVDDASHELKTPLSILEGYLSLLERKRDDSDFVDEYLEVTRKEQKRMKDLTGSLLDLSVMDEKISKESERVGLDPAPLTVKTLATYRKIHPDYVFDLKKEPEISWAISVMDFEKILNILLDNAVKYDQQNKRISITLARDSLTCVDKGIGIPDSDLPRVFDRFYRVAKDRNRKSGGNGLGLSILKSVSQKYGIEIKATSKPGRFTEFKLIFPAGESVAHLPSMD